MGGCDRLHLVERDAGIEFTEVEHRRRHRRAIVHPEHLAAVVADRCSNREVARGDPGDAAAEAVADHGDRPGLLHVFDGRGDIEHRRVERDRHHQLDAAGPAGVVVVEFDAPLASIEQRRRNRPVPERGVAVDDRADVGVHPEDLLHDHDRRRRALGVHLVRVEFVSVAGRESCHATTVRDARHPRSPQR